MANCTHLDQITVARPEQFAGCEDCLASGGRWSYCYPDDLAFVLEEA
jgi:hypothetical protein